MNTKLSLYLVLMVICSVNFTAHGTTHSDSFRVAVIESSVGSKEILTGKYQTGLDKLSKKRSRNNLKFNQAMGACAANIMLRELKQAVAKCDSAIEAHSNLLGDRKNYLKSIAYSNRGVAHYLSGDKQAAVKDFKHASSLNNNKIVQQNLLKLTRSNIEAVESSDDKFSD